MRIHLGTSFTVWNRRQAWFWLVLDQHGNGGTIGNAATEAEAEREACSAIEEMSAQRPSLSVSSGRTGGNALRLPRARGDRPALMPASNQVFPCSAAALGWMDWWMSIAHQVTDRMLTHWADLVLRSS
jgi:hypothetical protein